MPKKHKPEDLTQSVMSEIEKSQVKMRPRIYFVAGSLFTGLGIVGSFLFAMILASRAFLRLRAQGPFGYLWFGEYGVRPFLMTFPLLFLSLSILGLALGLALLRRYDISYKRSFVSISLVVVAAVAAFGFVMDAVGVNERLGQMHVARDFYKEDFSSPNHMVGEVIVASSSALIMQMPNGEQEVIHITIKTLLPFGSEFAIGERLRVVGEYRDGEFVAHGIGKGGLRYRKIHDQVKGVRVRMK